MVSEIAIWECQGKQVIRLFYQLLIAKYYLFNVAIDSLWLLIIQSHGSRWLKAVRVKKYDYCTCTPHHYVEG